MPTLGLGLGLNKVAASGGGGETPLDFSALTALPESRHAELETAINSAVSRCTLGQTAQDIINALTVGRGVALLRPGFGCLLNESGDEVAQEESVETIQTLTENEIANQPNVSLQPVSSANGLYADGTKEMNLGDLSAWSQGEAIILNNFDGTFLNRIFMQVGSSPNPSSIPFNDGRIYDSFGLSAGRAEYTTQNSAYLDLFYYHVKTTSGGVLTHEANGTALPGTTNTPGFSSAATLFLGGGIRWRGTTVAIALNEMFYTGAQEEGLKFFFAELENIGGVI